jgi:hypothetical protein
MTGLGSYVPNLMKTGALPERIETRYSATGPSFSVSSPSVVSTEIQVRAAQAFQPRVTAYLAPVSRYLQSRCRCLRASCHRWWSIDLALPRLCTRSARVPSLGLGRNEKLSDSGMLLTPVSYILLRSPPGTASARRWRSTMALARIWRDRRRLDPRGREADLHGGLDAD